MASSEKSQVVFNYHEQTKHRFNRYANSLGYLDWVTQPNPFRSYQHCAVHSLPFQKQDPNLKATELYSPSKIQAQPFSKESLSKFLALSLGLSAWKEFDGMKWSLRMNPSSGNLHPTEAYLMLTELESLDAGLYHYNPSLHALEQRSQFSDKLIEETANALQTKGFFIALSSIFWRESWKYGERAFRYCQHDIGHALAAIRFSAHLLGWHVTIQHNISDEDLSVLLGFDRTQWIKKETEAPEVLCWISPKKENPFSAERLENLTDLLKRAEIQGTVSALSEGHQDWPIIETVSEATKKTGPFAPITTIENVAIAELSTAKLTAAEVIRKRRSAQQFDSEKSLVPLAHFYDMLSATLPTQLTPPFDMELGSPMVHCLIFVHQVKGLESGLYFLVRNPSHFDLLKQSMHEGFQWKPVHDRLPLYLLNPGDYRETAKIVSCDQDIACDSAFSLGMLAQYQQNVESDPHAYKKLFWECGMIGQVLYLQAEACGFRGTGIGCYFDDAMNQKICGFQDQTFQSLYHFTVGFPKDDERLSSFSAYHHLQTK
jgi:SagB-type dehydrogenase family enzyme